MAFSQKHSGKVFVPWFNTEEWRSVYNLLTSNSQVNMKKALLILKIWKIRTPLLSAGVEGTLILLETILIDSSYLPDSQIIQIISITLMRFLNICAANSNKQGTFNQIVSKNDLPKWLIDIRHDIAHGHKLPSKSILELALSHSLDWLIEKYWKVQYHTIFDYIVNSEKLNAKILDCLNVHVRLNLNLYNNVEMNEYNEALMEKINYIASKRFNKSRTDIEGLLMVLEEILKQSFLNPDNKHMANKVAEILVGVNALLATHLETDKGSEIIPKSFKKLWSNLLNILYENEGFLTALFNQFWLIICNCNNETTKKIACTWICDLLHGLLKSQAIKEALQNTLEPNPEISAVLNLKCKLEKKYPEYQNCIEFESLDKLCLVSLDDFERTIVQNPNDYTIKFIDSLLRFNKNSEEYRHLVTDMIRNILPFERFGKTNQLEFSKILTIDDLPFDVGSLENHNFSITMPNHSDNNIDITLQDEITAHGRKWKLVQNTSLYKNIPLGVLPHQSRLENPLLIKDG